MVYDPSIPQAEDDMSVSQGEMLTNFTDLNTIYGTSGDHVAFNASADRGKHKKTTFVTQGTDPAADSPPTASTEMAMFALDEGTDTELYLRRENNGTVNQITKDGELFINVHPVFAINIKDLSPNANTTPGAYNFTVSNSFNFDAAASHRLQASKCIYKFFFTNPVVDSSGAATNDYMWTINGFDNSSNPVNGRPQNTNTYSNSVNSNFIIVEFVNQNGTTLTSLTGGSIVCWRFQ